MLVHTEKGPTAPDGAVPVSAGTEIAAEICHVQGFRRKIMGFLVGLNGTGLQVVVVRMTAAKGGSFRIVALGHEMPVYRTWGMIR